MTLHLSISRISLDRYGSCNVLHRLNLRLTVNTCTIIFLFQDMCFYLINLLLHLFVQMLLDMECIKHYYNFVQSKEEGCPTFYYSLYSTTRQCVHRDKVKNKDVLLFTIASIIRRGTVYIRKLFISYGLIVLLYVYNHIILYNHTRHWDFIYFSIHRRYQISYEYVYE